jgi:hypothetical protein
MDVSCLFSLFLIPPNIQSHLFSSPFTTVERVPFGPDEGAFANKYFQKANRDLMNRIKREKKGSWAKRPVYEVDYNVDAQNGASDEGDNNSAA